MTRFFLVRHAATAETGRRLTGWTPGVGLSDKGRAQADAVADRLKDVPFKAVYSSPIERTLETARAIASRHGLRVRSSEGIAEVRFGTWTGRTFGALRRTKLWPRVQTFPSGARFPDGESLFEVQARAVGEMDRIRRRHPKDSVCVVSHGDVIKLIAAHYLGVHIDHFQRIVVSPVSVTVIAVGDDGPVVLGLNVPAGGVVGVD